MTMNQRIPDSAVQEFDQGYDVIAALAAAGLATVPAKPTAAMLADGARAGGVSVETAWRVYQAMLRSAG